MVAEESIKSVLNASGQLNILYYEGLEKTEAGLTFRYDADGTITVNGTCSVSDTYAYIYGIYAYVTQGVEYSLIDPLNINSRPGYAFVANVDVFGDARTLYSYETHYTSAATRKISIVMRFANGTVYNNVQLKPMICVKSLFDISLTYSPPSKPNYELTWLEAEDRTSLAEVVDSGAKNLFNIFGATESKTNSITRTINSDSTITVSNDGTNTEVASLTYTITLNANMLYIISGCPSGGTDASYSLSIRTTGHQPVNNAADYGSGSSAFTVSSTGTYLVFIRVAPGYSFSNKVFKPMLCTKAAFSVSPKFVPYRPNYDLVVDTLDRKLNAKTELGSIDMNDVINNCRGSASITANAPVTGYCFVDVIAIGYDVKQQIQKLSSPSTYYIRHRRYQATSPYYSWTSWYKYEGTEVT